MQQFTPFSGDQAMFRRAHLLAIVLLIAAASYASAADEPKATKLAHIKLSGDLDETPVANDPLFGALSESFKDKLDRITKASKDKDVAAILLQIDNVSVGWGKTD